MLIIYALYGLYVLCVLAGLMIALLSSVPLGIVVGAVGIVLGAGVVTAWQVRLDV